MNYSSKLSILLLNFLPILLLGQDCTFTVKGYILDENTREPLPYSHIVIEETKTILMADSLGAFELKNTCPNTYHFSFSHLGYTVNHQIIPITKDTYFLVPLKNETAWINELVVQATKTDNSNQVSKDIDKEKIAQQSNKNLADILENIEGVSVLRNGAGISKPVIHGLYGNRISILNNGIAQSGQQWGNDHAPEIDPFVADNLTVIKGTSSLAYSGNSLGGVVLVEPKKIAETKQVQGTVNYIFQTNGLGHTINTQFQHFSKIVAWRITGTLKGIGDRKSAHYYLTNTGNREANIALQLEKKWSSKWNSSLYVSVFNTQIGILRGSQIGNVTDLQGAIGRAVPFFTNPNFSYQLQAPQQKVQHYLVKLETNYSISNHQTLSFRYGGQLNNRKEFDVRRNNRTTTPALSLLQQSHFAEAVYLQTFTNATLKAGLQGTYIDNTNNPETGILPLIPDYNSYQGSTFAIFKQEKNKFLYEAGARYDIKQLYANVISKTLPRKIEHYNRLFHNYSLSAGFKYQCSKNIKTNLNLGYAMRAPEVNELYSNGLHQGVSGIEEGDANLKPEKSFKAILSTDWTIRKKWSLQTSFYYQNIQDYMYLQAQNEFRLTIRGAFPVFAYHQTNASIYGTDVFLSYQPNEHINIIAKYAFVKGSNTSQHIPLVFMPANNLSGSMAYTFKDTKTLKQTNVTLSGRYVFKQTNLLPEQDFLAPPKAYFLLNLNLSTQIHFYKSFLTIGLSIENMLNQQYRDYLNRQRYFADDLGINASVRLQYSF